MSAVSARELVDALRDYYAEHGVMPSYATLSDLAGIKAKSWTHTLVGMLREEGILDVTPDKRLKPGPKFFERELFDSVRAGLPEHVPDAPAQSPGKPGIGNGIHGPQAPQSGSVIHCDGQAMPPAARPKY